MRAGGLGNHRRMRARKRTYNDVQHRGRVGEHPTASTSPGKAVSGAFCGAMPRETRRGD